MQYLLLFTEGILAFISPCLLPLLPLYISYMGADNSKGRGAFLNSLFFVLGFTVVFSALGAFAGSLGGLLVKYSHIVNKVTGIFVILMGLSMSGVLKGFSVRFSLSDKMGVKVLSQRASYTRSFLFGGVFSLTWSPCVGAFLGSALMLAAQRASALEGVLMLFVFSIGLGIPFVLSALLLGALKDTFDIIQRHYSAVSLICGLFLVIMGIFMFCGGLENIIKLAL